MCWSIHTLQRRSQHRGKLSGKFSSFLIAIFLTDGYSRLKDLHGDWHEFESKALRKENERKAQDARRAVRMEEHQKEKEKRRASGLSSAEREPKRPRPNSSQEAVEVK